MKLDIITPEGIAVSCDCDSISLPSTEGIIEVMAGHESMIIQLSKGCIIYKNNEKVEKFSIDAGFTTVNNSICQILLC